MMYKASLTGGPAYEALETDSESQKVSCWIIWYDIQGLKLSSENICRNIKIVFYIGKSIFSFSNNFEKLFLTVTHDCHGNNKMKHCS